MFPGRGIGLKKNCTVHCNIIFFFKVGLTKQLSETTSQISALQLEVSSLKKKEFELSQQVEHSGKSSRRHSEELETLKAQHNGKKCFIHEYLTKTA